MLESQRLKTEIITALDRLPIDRLKLLAEFVAFLRYKTDPVATLEPSQAEAIPSDNPILQLGLTPITEEITDASVNHDRYIYS